jgi:hypothetical protein
MHQRSRYQLDFLHKNSFFYWWYSWNATYESLLGSNNKPFSQPIPLCVRPMHYYLKLLGFHDGPKHLYLQEMVDLLVDTWEHEGLYD